MTSRVPVSDIAVGVAAAVLYAFRLGDWSLWLDEVTSLYFSRHPQHAFAQSAVAYFWLLKGVFDLTDMSVVAGRALSAAFGVANVVLVGALVRRCTNPRAGVLAAAMFGACLLHLFWAQSIRYYTMLLSAELTASLLLFEGVMHRRRLLLVLAGVVASASVCVHYTALLMLPAWALFLGMLASARPQLHVKSCLFAGLLALLPFAVTLILRYPSVQALQATGALGEAATFYRIFPLLVRAGFYVGAPMCLLAAVGAWLPGSSWEGKQLLLALASAPIAGIAFIAALGLANASLHHALLAVVGLAGLAGFVLDASCRKAESWWCRTMFAATAAYYAVWIGLYFTVMHGDRPRWREAAEALNRATSTATHRSAEVEIYSTEPFVLAHHLGVPAESLFHQRRVRKLAAWEDVPTNRPAWVVIDAGTLRRYQWHRLGPNAVCIATFEAHSGPRDRTVAVFRLEM
jgi:hypothetical protein